MKMAESFPKRLENTMGKGEIDGHEQFLLFPLCFLKTCTADTLKPGLVWEKVNPLPQVKITHFQRIYRPQFKCV